MPRIFVNVSGVTFQFGSKALESYPSHTLTKLYKNAYDSGRPLSFDVDRPADSFAAILAFYQTGELHIPTNVCPRAFRGELDYWNIPATTIESCCLYRYYEFMDQLETRQKLKAHRLRQLTADTYPPCLEGHSLSRWQRTKQRIWNIIDHKEKSILSTVYLCVVFAMMLLGILVLALSTLSTFQRQPTPCEMLEYLDHSQHELLDHIHAGNNSIDCENFEPPDNKSDPVNRYWYQMFNDDYDISFEYPDEYPNSRDTKRLFDSLPQLFVRHKALDTLEILVGVFFSVDCLLRLGTCPSIKRYFKSVVNVSDVIALLGFFTYLVIVNAMKEYKYTNNWFRVIDYAQVFRILRLCRVVKNVRASRVLVFSIRKNVRDAALLGMLLLICVSMSSCLIYFFETRDSIKSIPQAWYWSIITITTVGYGDLSPQSTAGQVLASILAICGVLLLAITLPIFVNNFISLYNYSCLDEKIDESISDTENNNHGSHNSTKLSKIKRFSNNTTEIRHVPDTPTNVSIRDIHIPGEVVESIERKNEL